MEPASHTDQLSRRDFLKVAKETAKALTAAALVSAIRSSFAARPRPTPPDLTPATQPPERPVVYEKEIKDRLVENMLKQLTVLDTGKPGTGEPLEAFDVWRVITGNLTATKEEFEASQNNTNTIELTHRERVARNYMYQAAHGKNVMNSLRTGLATAADYHGDANIEFVPKTTAEHVNTLFNVQELEDKWYNESGTVRGPRLQFDSPAPEVDLEKGKIISGSFQFGTHVLSFAEERLTIENLVMTHEDVRRFLQKQADYRKIYNSTNAPNGEFILPIGKILEDITSITVVRFQNGEVIDQKDIPIQFNQEKQDVSATSREVSDTAPIEHYTLHFNTGEMVEINPNPNDEDYSQTWTPMEQLTRRPPEEIIGAFDRDNPFREENVQQVKEFVRQHPDNFWVFAIGNHGDILTEGDMVDMPENCIHVGQITMAGNRGEKYYSGTFGGTVGNSQTIFLANEEFGIEGDGSSLATPQIAAAAGLYSIETQGKPIKRKDFIEYLKNNNAIKQEEWLVPYYEGQTSAEPWKINILDVSQYSDFIDKIAKRIVSNAHVSSRRDFLRGRHERT